MADPYYANVSLLLPMNGANNGTVFTDYSPTPKTITRYGDAKTVTAQYKYYGSSGYFDGTGDYLTTPASADWNFGTGAFTIEAWIYLAAFSGSDRPVYNLRADGTTSATPIVLGVSSAGKVYLWWSASSLTGGTTLSLNQWYHIAAARSGTSLKLFLNGVVDATVTDSAAHGDSVKRISIGGEPATSQYFNGYMGDVCVTKGVARYTADFTPPTGLVPAISGTILDTSGAPCARTVHLFDRASGNKLGTTISDASTGQYALYGPPGGNEVIRVVLADEGTLYNDIIDRILPA